MDRAEDKYEVSTGNIEWVRDIGLYYGKGADGSNWQVMLPKMTDILWEAYGPKGFNVGTEYASARDAAMACEVEYKRRLDEATEAPSGRLRALVANAEPHFDKHGYRDGDAVPARALSELVDALIEEGRIK